jgi:amidase
MTCRILGSITLLMLLSSHAIALDARSAKSQATGLYPLEERSLTELQADLTAGHVTSERLVREYLDRVARIDAAGPRLRSVIALNPRALEQARALDEERRMKGARGPLHGIPILLKDNIESTDPMPTTAGSLALEHNITNREGSVIAALRAAGVIVLGKTNLSEWANFRSEHAIGGWSAVGGLTRNPYVLDRTTCGSSAGNAAAVAASLAAAAIGTETDGSITCPSSMNALVGLKPTLGLLSQQYIVPVSRSQDTLGPMARSVKDAALLLTAMTQGHTNYATQLSVDALKNKRVGMIRIPTNRHPELVELYARAKQFLVSAGATPVDVQLPNSNQIYAAETLVLTAQFKEDLNTYLASTPPAVKVRTLADVIEFNARTPAETEYFGQEFMQRAQASTTESASYQQALSLGHQWAMQEMQRLFEDNTLDVLVGPTSGTPWRIDLVNGDQATSIFGAMPAVSGYPHLTVPMGFVRELPVGLSFITPPNSEATLLAMGYAFESIAQARRAPKYLATIDNPDLRSADH